MDVTERYNSQEWERALEDGITVPQTGIHPRQEWERGQEARLPIRTEAHVGAADGSQDTGIRGGGRGDKWRLEPFLFVNTGVSLGGWVCSSWFVCSW